MSKLENNNANIARERNHKAGNRVETIDTEERIQ